MQYFNIFKKQKKVLNEIFFSGKKGGLCFQFPCPFFHFILCISELCPFVTSVSCVIHFFFLEQDCITILGIFLKFVSRHPEPYHFIHLAKVKNICRNGTISFQSIIEID